MCKIPRRKAFTAETIVDVVIRLNVAGEPAGVTTYLDALHSLACVMAVQAEDGLYSLGSPDACYADGSPSEFVANISSTYVRAVLIQGATSTKER